MASRWHYNSAPVDESDESDELDPEVLLSQAEAELVELDSDSVLELEVDVDVDVALEDVACTDGA